MTLELLLLPVRDRMMLVDRLPPWRAEDCRFSAIQSSLERENTRDEKGEGRKGERGGVREKERKMKRNIKTKRKAKSERKRSAKTKTMTKTETQVNATDDRHRQIWHNAVSTGRQHGEIKKQMGEQ